MTRLVRRTELTVAGEKRTLGDVPLIMGIVNVTPDSFSDGGRFLDSSAAVEHALRLAEEGADWLDVGGESTRPGADPVSEPDELKRVLPVVEALSQKASVPISIDTYKPEVARLAVQAGASIINDVTGFRDLGMRQVAAACDAACICMHMRGTPQTMRDLAAYENVVEEVKAYLAERIDVMAADGISRERIVIDPGIGFAKNFGHNVELLRSLNRLHELQRPILLGASRKRIIGDLTGRQTSDRLAGTLATALIGCQYGVHVLRVHDVGPVRDALAVYSTIIEPQRASSSRR